MQQLDEASGGLLTSGLWIKKKLPPPTVSGYSFYPYFLRSFSQLFFPPQSLIPRLKDKQMLLFNFLCLMQLHSGKYIQFLRIRTYSL